MRDRVRKGEIERERKKEREIERERERERNAVYAEANQKR